MDRKDFIKKTLMGTGIAVVAPSAAIIKNDIEELQPLTPIDIVGYNHLPNQKSNIMENVVLHKADTRGFADHGWLKSHHTFSFANYYNPDRMHFGVLRVLNDDQVAGGMGFGTHPHDNMEIISIPLYGDLKHKDSMGNEAVIRNGDIQVMSAGTGIKHSEFNKNQDKEVKFLQIWLFPNKRNVEPRYDQMTLNPEDRLNKLQQVLSPYPTDQGVWIHQNAWFYLGNFEKGYTASYSLKDSNNGLYAFILDGTFSINGIEVRRRDGIGFWDTTNLDIKALSNGSEILLMDVPMSA